MAESKTFERFKTVSIQAPLAKIPDVNGKLEILADASDFEVEAVLMQEEHSFAYFSKTIDPTHRRYSSTKRETLEVPLAVQKFRVYFGKALVNVNTDQAAVVHLYSGRIYHQGSKDGPLNCKNET